MFSRALYYPYIHIPDNFWLRKAILYWDQINPIVPYEVERQIPPGHVSKELEKAGALEFVHPETILEYDQGAQLSDSFSSLVNREEFLSKIGPIESRDYSYQIHRHKFTDAILSALNDLGLYKEKPGDYNWLLFERRTGILYMGFLASSLARHLYLEPLTDEKEYRDGLLSTQLIPSTHAQVFVSFILENLLPSPKETIPVKKILKFKVKNERDLLAFRGLIRDTVKKLENCKDEKQFMRELDGVKDNIREGILALKGKLNENKIQTVLDSLEIAEKSIPEVNMKLETAKPSLEIKDVLAPLKGLVRIVIQPFKGRLRRNSILESSPYTYIFKVRKNMVNSN